MRDTNPAAYKLMQGLNDVRRGREKPARKALDALREKYSLHNAVEDTRQRRNLYGSFENAHDAIEAMLKDD